ncbi:uncharacterized protein LOC143887515 [Tasmannia lanceolata]|uniref:uncharacterized protein LOC143887515 n=1 Tax=Tasmannia lanceolata TaxID=3420 RepID=UPI00406455D2
MSSKPKSPVPPSTTKKKKIIKIVRKIVPKTKTTLPQTKTIPSSSTKTTVPEIDITTTSSSKPQTKTIPTSSPKTTLPQIDTTTTTSPPKITVPQTKITTTSSPKTTVPKIDTTTTSASKTPAPQTKATTTTSPLKTTIPQIDTTTIPKTTAPKTKTRIKIVKKIVKKKRPLLPTSKPDQGISETPPKEKEKQVDEQKPPKPSSQKVEKNPTSSLVKKTPNIIDKNTTTSKNANSSITRDEEMGVSERRRRRKTEIFIGGLDKDAKEGDIRKVFEKVGEVVEIRLMMNVQTGKNKGYAFLRYASAADAKRAVSEFAKVKVCGKQCAAAALEGNDTIFLGNIDKKWKKEDVIKLLQEIGIENIAAVTVMTDPNDPDINRGFAFLELETNRDAQNAYKKLQKKDVFGKDLNIKVAWAEPLNDPDEEEMLKVKSVYAEGIPSSWDEKNLKKYFKKFGEIERVVLARNIQSARRKDFAFVNYTTRESALACIESFNKEELIHEGSKVNVKVSLAKPVPKGKQSKGGSTISKDYSKEKPKAAQRDTKVNPPFNKGNSIRGVPGNSGVGGKSSTTYELIKVLREQATWKREQIDLGRGSSPQDFMHTLPSGKRPLSALGDDALYSDPRGYPRARLDASFPAAGSSYSTLSHSMAGASLPYYHQPGAGYAGMAYPSTSFQTRQGVAPYGGGLYPRY